MNLFRKKTRKESKSFLTQGLTGSSAAFIEEKDAIYEKEQKALTEEGKTMIEEIMAKRKKAKEEAEARARDIHVISEQRDMYTPWGVISPEESPDAAKAMLLGIDMSNDLSAFPGRSGAIKINLQGVKRSTSRLSRKSSNKSTT